MSCLSCKQLKEKHSLSFTRSLWTNRCEFTSSDQLRSHHTQDKLGVLPGQSVIYLLAYLFKYIRLFNLSKYIRSFNFSNFYFLFIKYKNQKISLAVLGQKTHEFYRFYSNLQLVDIVYL
jgi:hypothetical protein